MECRAASLRQLSVLSGVLVFVLKKNTRQDLQNSCIACTVTAWLFAVCYTLLFYGPRLMMLTTVDDVAKLQGAINLITDWAREWQLQVSANKCSLLNIGHAPLMLPITSMARHCPISHTFGTLE